METLFDLYEEQNRKKLNVLIACEESQAVCKEFRALGHRAFSCDIQECSGGHPEWHICGDVIPLLNGNCEFVTSDTHTHTHTARSLGSYYRASSMHIPHQLCNEVSQFEDDTIGENQCANGIED